MKAVLDGHIKITPDVRGGRPRITGTRITVTDIVIMHLRLGQSLEEIAGKYDLDLAERTLPWLTTTTTAQKLMGASKWTRHLQRHFAATIPCSCRRS